MNILAKIINQNNNKIPQNIIKIIGKCEYPYHTRITYGVNNRTCDTAKHICKSCGNIICSLGIIRTRKKCLYCINYKLLRNVCDICNEILRLVLCNICGKVCKRCNYYCKNHTKIKLPYIECYGVICCN